MAVVSSDFLTALFTNYRAIYQQAFLAALKKAEWKGLCTMAPSNTLTENYNWLGTVPKMEEWIGPRTIQGLVAFNYSITNKHYQAAIAVDRDTIEDDRYMLIKPRIQQLAQEAVRFPDELVFALLNLADATLCYDGQYMADTDHVDPGAEYATNQSNKLTGTGVTVALLEDDFVAAIAAIRNFKDDRGRFINLGISGQDMVVVAPPALEHKFRQLLYSSTIAQAAGVAPIDNVLKGAANLVISPWLTDVNDWFLLNVGTPIKPIIFQDRKQPQFVAQDKPDSDTVFDNNEFKYGVDMRCNVGFGDWRTLVMTTNT